MNLIHKEKLLKTFLNYSVFPILIILLFSQVVNASGFTELESKANQGDAKAMYELGQMYENGVGTIQNYVEAHKWYNISASRGYVKARKAHDAVAKKMTPSQIEKAFDNYFFWSVLLWRNMSSLPAQKRLARRARLLWQSILVPVLIIEPAKRYFVDIQNFILFSDRTHPVLILI